MDFAISRWKYMLGHAAEWLQANGYLCHVLRIQSLRGVAAYAPTRQLSVIVVMSVSTFHDNSGLSCSGSRGCKDVDVSRQVHQFSCNQHLLSSFFSGIEREPMVRQSAWPGQHKIRVCRNQTQRRHSTDTELKFKQHQSACGEQRHWWIRTTPASRPRVSHFRQQELSQEVAVPRFSSYKLLPPGWHTSLLPVLSSTQYASVEQRLPYAT